MDVFGDLSEWGVALHKLEELKKAKALDEHQHGMARVLRYRENPRLTWAVLGAAKEVSRATDALIAEVLAILVSRNSIIPHRVLAAEALGHLIPRRIAGSQGVKLDVEFVIQTMASILKSPEPPVVALAVDHALQQIRGPRRGGRR